MDVDKQIEQAKLSAVKWEQRARQVAAEGNLIGAFRYHQWMMADLAFIKMLETPSQPTGNYTRFGTGIPEQMIAIGPHEAIQKAYYDRNFGSKKISPPTRSHADDDKELPASEAG